MFSYYGTKKKLSSKYPESITDTIIEPFCGAAMYSLYGDNWKKNVILNDKYDKIYLAWYFLINSEMSDIRVLPDLVEGLNLDTINSLSKSEKALLGFYCNPSSAVPKKTVTARGEKSWKRHKKYLIDNSYKIKHWQIHNKSYDELPNIEATWFIDPPYKYGGQYYHSSANNKHINYVKLANWCKNRKGAVIVCENDKADWLDFKPLSILNGQLHTTTEVVYLNGFEKTKVAGKI